MARCRALGISAIPASPSGSAHMRDQCPDKHRDSTKYSGDKNSHVEQEWKICEKLRSKIIPI
jgi:hypothetical protein